MILKEDIRSFIKCYIEIWKSLKRILPNEYVVGQLEQASSNKFKEYLITELNKSSTIFLIAEELSEIIGLAWGNIREDGSSWLSFLGVTPSYRRMGIGKLLLTRFIEESEKRCACKISLDTDPRLVPAIELYEKMGFDRVGFSKNSYGLELIVYTKILK